MKVAHCADSRPIVIAAGWHPLWLYPHSTTVHSSTCGISSSSVTAAAFVVQSGVFPTSARRLAVPIRVAGALVFVPVVAVGGVPVTAVHIVDVVTVLNSLVSALGAVYVTVVVFGGDVLRRLALVPVTFMHAVGVVVVQVVGVTVVRDRYVAALGMVLVSMGLMNRVSHDFSLPQLTGLNLGARDLRAPSRLHLLFF
jgi:hypothetical protein